MYVRFHSDSETSHIRFLQGNGVEMTEAIPSSSWAIDAYRRARTAVVAIHVQKTDGEVCFGSGFVIDRIGHVITNTHVVEDQLQILVEFSDGTREFAALVGLDFHSDVAVIHINLKPSKLHPIAIGNSDMLVVGQSVLAIGHPFGNDWTLTSGIISGLNRTLRDPENVNVGGTIQTNAVINPGNSGGPLLNSTGEFIGVNTAGYFTENGGNTGNGYAIPAKLAIRVAKSLISEGRVTYSYSGIYGEDLSHWYVDVFHLPSDLRGVLVTTISTASPAAECGIRPCVLPVEDEGSSDNTYIFDVVAAIDGYNVKGFSDMISYLDVHTLPGQEVTLTVLRVRYIDEVARIRVRTSKYPLYSSLHKNNATYSSHNYFGITALELTGESDNSGSPFELTGSLLLLEVSRHGEAEAQKLQGYTERKLSAHEWERMGKPPDRRSLASRDIITEIDGIPLQGMQQLNRYVEQISLPGEEVTLTVHRFRDSREWMRIPMTLCYR